MKPIAVIVAMLMWSMFCWHWYTCGIYGLCIGNNQEQITEINLEDQNEFETNEIEEDIEKPLLFLWNDYEPSVNERAFELQKDSLVSALSNDEIIEVIGMYSLNETNTGEYENLGLARASKIKALLKDKIPSTRIHLNSMILDSLDFDTTHPFEAVIFNFLNASFVEAKVEQIEKDKFSIYFAYKTQNLEMDINIAEFLKDVAIKMDTTTEVVSITGYTDNVGSQDYNKALGLQRAASIKERLLLEGVVNSRIKINSRGKLDPIATNETEEGRAKNRRVELVFENLNE